MKLRSALFLALFVAAHLSPFPCAAARPSQQPPPIKLSLKVIIFEGSSPTFYPLGDDENSGMGAVINSFRPLPWYQPAEGDAVARSVSLRFKREGACVRVAVFVHKSADPLIEGEQVAERLIGMNEEYAVAELANHGVEPLRLGLVRRMTVRLTPPRVSSKAHAVEVVGVEVREHVPSFELTLRNASEKKINAVDIQEFRGEAPKGRPPLSNGVGKAFVKPGETWQVTLEFGWTHKVTPAGHVPEPPDRVVINCVTFTDGGYEGDVVFAATQAATALGGRVQLVRILGLMREWPETHEVGALESVRRLRAQIKALPVEAEAAHLEELKARYAELPAGEFDKLSGAVSEGMRRARDWERSELRRLMKNLNEETPAAGFVIWLRQHRVQYERLLGLYQNAPAR